MTAGFYNHLAKGDCLEKTPHNLVNGLLYLDASLQVEQHGQEGHACDENGEEGGIVVLPQA